SAVVRAHAAQPDLASSLVRLAVQRSLPEPIGPRRAPSRSGKPGRSPRRNGGGHGSWRGGRRMTRMARTNPGEPVAHTVRWPTGTWTVTEWTPPPGDPLVGWV